mmetsp:Transcript_23601/g.47861  ORF Transcript_23601/g.47861 Transcript_23601/m.47861 type:complete len:227 (+) Transcript_23601:2032-2712(+)
MVRVHHRHEKLKRCLHLSRSHAINYTFPRHLVIADIVLRIFRKHYGCKNGEDKSYSNRDGIANLATFVDAVNIFWDGIWDIRVIWGLFLNYEGSQIIRVRDNRLNLMCFSLTHTGIISSVGISIRFSINTLITIFGSLFASIIGILFAVHDRRRHIQRLCLTIVRPSQNGQIVPHSLHAPDATEAKRGAAANEQTRSCNAKKGNEAGVCVDVPSDGLWLLPHTPVV